MGVNCLCVYCSFKFPINVKLYHYLCDCNGNKYLLCLCCCCCYCCNMRKRAGEENKRELEKNQDVELTDMNKRGVKVNTSSPQSTLSVEPIPKTTSTFRSFAELSPVMLPGIASKLKPRLSGTATALSSTCKTASGNTQPGLVDRVTPYHGGLENSHGGQYGNV